MRRSALARKRRPSLFLNLAPPLLLCSSQPKPDPDAPSTRANRGRAAAAIAIKPDPEGPDAGGGGAPPSARRGRAAAAAAAPSTSSSSDSEGGGARGATRVLTASDRLRSPAGPQFAYAAKLARHAPPPVELCPPPPAESASALPGGASPRPTHFPVSSFGTGLDGGLTLLQLPARLPAAPGDKTPPPPGAPAVPEDGCSTIADLPPGVIGRLLVLRSGAVKVHIGGVEFDLVPGMPVDALAAGVRLNLASAAGKKDGGANGTAAAPGPSSSARRPPTTPATAASVGQVINRATLVPDVGKLLRGEAAPAYRKAAGFLGPRQLDAAAEGAAVRGTPGRARAVVASDEEEDVVMAEATRAVGRVVMDESD